jgi:hypothetical protein
MNKNVHFSKTEDKKIKQAMSESWYQWEWGGYKEKV